MTIARMLLPALSVLPLMLLLGACSMVRLGYGHLDTVATWMAHDYFDLDAVQRDRFTRRFERLHVWHRSEELPDYAHFLTEIQSRAQRGLQSQDLLWLFDGFRQRYARIAVRGAPDAADLLATLSTEQINTFRSQIDRDNRKFLDEHRTEGGLAERRKAMEQRTLSQLRDWVGSLSEAQETRAVALLQQVPLTDGLRHEERLRRQREFFDLLELRHSERRMFAQRLRHWLEHWEAGRSAAQTRQFDESWRKRAEFYAAMDRTLSAEQRRHLVHRLQDFIDDFQQLAGRPPAATAAAELK